MRRGKRRTSGPIGSASTIASGPPQRDTIPLTPEVGAILGERYQLIELLGRGAFGAVWRARDRVAAETVAVKLMSIDRDAPGQLERLRRELRAARKVMHPGVVRIHDLVEVGENLVLSMELVEGDTLQAVIERDGPLEAAVWMSLAQDLAAALAAAHDAGVTHRDLKPANVLVRRGTGRAVITDFGVSRVVQEDETPIDVAATEPSGETSLTADGAIVGTPLYMAPEQLAGRRATAASDVYAFGLVLWFAATGRVPSTGDSIGALRMARERATPPLEAARGDLPAPARAAVDRMLSLPSDERPLARALVAMFERTPDTPPMAASARTRASAQLAASTRDQPTAPTPSADPATTVDGRPRRGSLRAIVWLSAALVVVLSAIALVAARPWDRRGPPATSVRAASPLRVHVEAIAADQRLEGVRSALAAMAAQRYGEDLRVEIVGSADAAAVVLTLALERAGDEARLKVTRTVEGRSVLLGTFSGVSVAAAIDRSTVAVESLARGAAPRRPTAAESDAMSFLGTSSFAAWRAYDAGERKIFGTIVIDTAKVDELLDRAIAEDPGWIHPHLARVVARGTIGEGADAAVQAAEEAGDRARDARGWQILAAMERLRAGDHDGARHAAELLIDTRDVTGGWTLALVYLFHDETDALIALLRRFHEARPDLQFGSDLLTPLAQAGRADEIPAIVTRWIALAPASEQARAAGVMSATRAQEWRRAVELAEELIFLFGPQPHHRTTQCDALIAAGDLRDARAVADRMLNTDPASHARGLYRLGILATLEGRFANAYVALQEALLAARPLGTNGETFQIVQALRALAWIGDREDEKRWTNELAGTFEVHGALTDAVAARFELAHLERKRSEPCPDLDAAVASVPDGRQRTRARVELMRVAAAHGCSTCAEVMKVGRAFREPDPRSVLRFAECATQEGATDLAARAIDDVIGRRAAYAGFGGSIDQPYEWVMAHYRRGQLAETSGDRETARRAYRQFVDLWGGADRVVPEVVAARKALARLDDR